MVLHECKESQGGFSQGGWQEGCYSTHRVSQVD